MFCRNCGAEVNQNAMACPKCGLAPLTEKKFCQECGAETKENQIMCVKCGVQLILKKPSSSSKGNLNVSSQSLNDGLEQLKTKTHNVPGLIVSILMLIALFLPWYSVGSSGFGYDNHVSINAMKSTYGIFALLFTLSAIVLSFIRFKWTIAAGALCFVFSLIFILDTPDAAFGGYGFEAHAGPSWGIFVFMALSIGYSVLNIKTLKEN